MKATIELPTSLAEIRLGDYMELVTKSEFMEPVATNRLMIHLFCKLDYEYIDVMSVVSFEETALHLNSLFADTKHPFVRTFKMHDKEFGFIPNMDNITMKEYVDLSVLDKWENMNKTMAVLYRPIVEKKKAWFNKNEEQYSIEAYDSEFQYAELFKLMPLNIAFGALFFLTSLKKDLLIAMLSYLEKNPQIASLMEQHNLDLSGAGTIVSTL